MQSHPLVDSHPYARRVRLTPVPKTIMWNGGGSVSGHPILLRHQRPRPSWPGYPSGCCPPDMKQPLRKLAVGMHSRGWFPFTCNCIGRDPEQDAEFRGQGGKAAHDPKTWSPTSVGWHLSGRAIDVKLPGAYNERPLPEERVRMHADLTELAKGLGFTSIADLGEYDDWHFDYKGPFAKMGYREGALASLLDVGGWRGPRWEWRAVQAQLWRVGLDVGVLDGSPGNKTRGLGEHEGKTGLTMLDLDPHGEPKDLLPVLYALSDPATLAV